MERDWSLLSSRTARSGAIHRAGGAGPGSDRADQRGANGELRSAKPASEPTGSLSAKAGGGAGSDGRSLSGAVGGDGDSSDGSAQGWRSLSAVGFGVSA